MKELSIIIPTFERGEIFLSSFKAAKEATKNIDAEIIVVNDSKDQEIQLENYESVLVVNNKGKGVASARNFGATLATSENLVFLDDDMFLTKESIERLLYYFNKAEKAFYLFNWDYPPELYELLQKSKFGRYLIRYNFVSLKGWLGDEWEEKDVFQLNMGASYCLPIKKKHFDEIGGYNEDFPHAGAEDYEFFTRSKKVGFKTFVDTTITIYQNEKDRIVMQNWLSRKKRNGETISVAVQLGHDELKFSYNAIKKTIYPVLILSKPFFYFIYKLVPNVKWMDILSFRIINTLLGTYLFEGYHSTDSKG